MDQTNTPQNQISQTVEREIRQLIGDLQVNVIVLKTMLESAQNQLAQLTPAPQATPLHPVPTTVREVK